MAAWQVEQAVCHGRGFNGPSGSDAAGLLYLLSNWAQRSAALGGWGGYMHDDQSSITDPGSTYGGPYIVLSTHNAAGPNVVAKYIQVILPISTAGTIQVLYWLYWDPFTHTGRGCYGGHNIPTLDSADFIYDFRGGPEALVIQTFTNTGVWNASWIDELTGDPNLLDSVEATTSVTNWVDNGNIQIRGMDLGGTAANALDASGNTYLSFINVSGSTWRIDQFSDAARSTLVWRSSNFTALAAAANKLAISGTAQGGSGVTNTIYLQGPTLADVTIVFRYNKITVGTGEGAQFVNGNYYFIYDLLTRPSVNSFRVISKSVDELTIDRLYRPFPVGSKIGSYPHKFVIGGGSSGLLTQGATIPYFNVAGTMAATNAIAGMAHEFPDSVYPFTNWWSGFPTYGGGIGFSTDNAYIDRMSPNRKGEYAVQRPGIAEYFAWGNASNQAGSGQTAYGQLKNIIVGSSAGMSPNIHGRKLSGIDYTYFRNVSSYVSNGNAGSYAAMIRETESET